MPVRIMGEAHCHSEGLTWLHAGHRRYELGLDRAVADGLGMSQAHGEEADRERVKNDPGLHGRGYSCREFDGQSLLEIPGSLEEAGRHVAGTATTTSVAAAAAPADCATAGRGLARRIDMFSIGRCERIALWIHRIVGQGRPFPRLDAHELGVGAPPERRETERTQHGDEYETEWIRFHDG
jgi:hypothetical protein